MVRVKITFLNSLKGVWFDQVWERILAYVPSTKEMYRYETVLFLLASIHLIQSKSMIKNNRLAQFINYNFL